MLRRKGNLHRALEDVGVAIDFLQQRVAEQAQAAADLAAANQQTAVPISTILARKLEMYIVVRGAIHYALGQYEVAIDDFTRVLNTDPEHAEAYQQRSLALTQLRKFEMALTDLDVYCSMRTEDLGSLLRLANLFSHLKHYGEAMQLFSRVLQMAPGSPQILYGIGVAHFRRREWSQAEAHFTLFLKKSRVSFPTAQLRLAEVYERQGRYQDALSLLLSLKEQKYNLRRLNQCLGRVHMCLLDYRHAQESFMVALQQDDKDSISLFLHSIVCFELGDLDQTITSLNRLFEIEPKHVEGNFLRGWIYMHDSQYQPAFEHFDRAVNAQRTHVLAVQCRAFCCVFLNQLDKALKDCNRLLAVSQSPAFIASFALVSTTLTPLQSAARSTAATLVLRAFIQTLTKKYDAALLDLNRALEDDRDSPLLHLYRAECWRHKGFPTEAIESYQRCIEELNAMLQRTAIATSTIALALNSSQEGVNIASSASIAAAKQKSRMAILAAQEMNKRHGSQLDSISEQSVKSESEREANARMEREKIEIAAAEDAAANEAEQASRDRLKTIDRVQKNRLRMEGRFNLNRADLASIHNMLGTLLFESQAVADSLSHFDLAIVHSQPNSLAAAHCNKGTIFLEMKRYEDALDQLSIAISRDMGSPDILNNYGVALDHSGQVPKSLEILKSATDSAPNHPLLPLNLGNVLAKLHRHEDAILAYDSHYRAVPPHEPWYVARVANNRGVCHAQQHRPTYALRDLDHALRLFPDLQHATFNRAHVHLTLTDVWSALNDIRTEIRVNNSVYLRNLFEFCKRWEVGLSVACREMSIGFSALPVIRDIAVHDIADEEYRRTRQAIQEAIEMRAPFAVSNDALCVPTCLPDSPQPEPHSFDPFELLDNQSLSSKRLAALLRPSPKIRLLTDQELSSDTVNIAVLTPFQQSLSNALALWKSARSKSVSVPLNIDAAADAVVQFAPVQSDQPELISRSTMSDAQISSEKQMLELLLQAVYSIPTGRQNFRMSLLGRR
jgi:tetratricopeptide (TPR) repeat protein